MRPRVGRGDGDAWRAPEEASAAPSPSSAFGDAGAPAEGAEALGSPDDGSADFFADVALFFSADAPSFLAEVDFPADAPDSPAAAFAFFAAAGLLAVDAGLSSDALSFFAGGSCSADAAELFAAADLRGFAATSALASAPWLEGEAESFFEPSASPEDVPFFEAKDAPPFANSAPSLAADARALPRRPAPDALAMSASSETEPAA